MSQKRSIFKEVIEGLDEIRDARDGRVTLRTTSVPERDSPNVSGEEIKELRARLSVSRSVLARYLRTSTRTLENWEQGRAQPNDQAALLIRLIANYPDMVERIQHV